MGDDKSGSLWSSIRNWTYWKILVVGILVGIIFWGGFNTAIEYTNTTEFCISCHEMRDTVYPEYQESLHFKNPVFISIAILSPSHITFYALA